MRFVVVHHTPCAPRRWHYRIDATGTLERGLAESETGERRSCIDVVLEGDFEDAAPTPAQDDALRTLLRDVILRYPHIRVGGHRQLRGSKTTCPGRSYPMRELHAWCERDLVAYRDEKLDDVIAAAYGPGGPTGWR